VALARARIHKPFRYGKETIMKTIKITLLMIGTLILTALLAGNFATEGGDDAIVVGILENTQFAYAKMMRNSFDMAQAEINAQGGIKGRKLRLVYADDGGDKRQGALAVKALVRDHKAVMLTGGYSSSNTLTTAQIADELDVPFLVCTAADDRITQRGRSNIFRLNPPASQYAHGLEEILGRQLQPRSMAIIYENSPFGTTGARQMLWFCRQNDITVTDIVPYHKERVNPAYFDRLIAPLIQTSPEVIFMASYKRDGVLLVNRIRAAQIPSHLIGAAGGFTHPDFIALTGEASQFMMTAALWTADLQFPLARTYAADYRSKYRETPDYHGAEAYSALLVAVDALRRSTTMKAADIRSALAATQMDTPFGSVAFESRGLYERQNSQSTVVLQVLEGRHVCVWPQGLSAARPVLPPPSSLGKMKARKASVTE
jgi:branched-chain amino acid transport system substrate-binding protein